MNNLSKIELLLQLVNRIGFILILACLGTLFSSCTRTVETKEALVVGEIPMCGTVQFSDGCGEQLDSLISYGLALVHHMTYDEAEMVFDRVINEDPDCFWGPWGKALTFIHPLWSDTPDDEKLELGWELSQKALSLASKEKEKAYGNALAAYYHDGKNKTEQERLKSFEQSWETAYEKNPDDMEVKTFYALSIIATVDPADKSYKSQLKAGGLAEEVLRVIPDHPGGFHYAIHAYDAPSLGEKAIEVANNYGKIAPEIPHALHMPSHIFTRQGMWEESIDWNTRSAKAALDHPLKGETSFHYFHALDYMVYAHLQRLEDKKTEKILEVYKNLDQPYQKNFATAYALAAMESRFFLERQKWDQAAKLNVPDSDFPWNKFPESEALTHFAKGLGAARSGEVAVAEAAIKRLGELQQNTSNPYWSGQLEIQKKTVMAWLAYTKGDKSGALKTMKAAAELESSTEKHAVTPGELLPAVELYGDLLLAVGKPGEALAQYEAALKRSPGRFNSLYGAAHAAERSGQAEKARNYYERLIKLSNEAEISSKQREYALSYMSRS